MKSFGEPPFVRHGKVQLFYVKMRRVRQTPLCSLLFTIPRLGDLSGPSPLPGNHHSSECLHTILAGGSLN